MWNMRILNLLLWKSAEAFTFDVIWAVVTFNWISETSSSNSIIFWSLIAKGSVSFHNTFKNAKAMEKCIFYFCNASIVRKCAIVTQALDKKAAQDQDRRDDKLKSINPIQTFTASCIHRGKKSIATFHHTLNEKVL